MAYSIQEQLQLKSRKMISNLYDYKYMKVLGSNSSQRILLHIVEDKFKNTHTTIDINKQFWCKIEFPGKEIPVLPSTDDNQSSTTLMLYDILPIEMSCLSTEIVVKGDIVLYRYLLKDYSVQVLPLQVVNQVIKGNMVGNQLDQYILAPITDYSLVNMDQFTTIIENYRLEISS
jgi:hypothetical protein